MLKRGMMRIGDEEYSLYELRIKDFYRLDIMKKDGMFHTDVDSVFFSCYGKKRKKQFGDEALYQKYMNTVNSLRKMPGQIVRESRWEGDIYIMIDQKGETGNRFVAETHDGEWYGEIYERDGVIIVMGVFDGTFKTALPPINYKQFQYSGTYRKRARAGP